MGYERGKDLRRLRRLIVQHFDREELRLLVYDLAVNWDELPGERMSAKAHALLQHLNRRGRLKELIALLREERPQVEWPDAPPMSDDVADLTAETPADSAESTLAEEVTILKKVAKLWKPHDKDGQVIVTSRNVIHKSLLGSEVAKFPLQAIDEVKVTRSTLVPALRLTCFGQEYIFTFFTMAQARAVAGAISQAKAASGP